ncbi:uroporphyrinogen-III C-methyltransferase [Roseicella frigidaeris]|uniref:uroporphyrinogen-III C-methyltransferase n=1 Tax=Roseicella frigidaeris TaxID=2230885 RepID=A0A327MIK5_9PROT|nr:uroporphyrinogen-III C-methyltransferase [Roseicella frigidaeris]RAI60008.1 uroporphyrinogen-III C-methyltransferase [Roseicella frigidaeris]
MAGTFTVTLDLTETPVLLAGGDAEQAEALLAAGARLRVVAPAPGPALAALAEAGRLTLHRRAVLPADLDGVRLCVVALEGAAGEAVAAMARAAGALVSAVAAPPRACRGRASLVGAGPGDPALLTVKAVRALETADVVLYDKLIDPRLLDLAPAAARRIDVGKRCGRHAMSQAAINRLLVAEVRRGGHVVRLKGGDPFVFGRGGEELEALRAAGAAVEVIPGITAALATAARLGLPLTHRGLSRSLHLITAHGREGDVPPHDWRALAAAGGTLAVYMGARTLPRVAEALLAAGMPPATPAIAVENATLPGERRIRRTLADIAAAVAEAAVEGPTLTLIGEVVALAGTEAPAEAARHAA